ncbi:unnamed protein product, partial [Allacma fusca]
MIFLKVMEQADVYGKLKPFQVALVVDNGFLQKDVEDLQTKLHAEPVVAVVSSREDDDDSYPGPNYGNALYIAVSVRKPRPRGELDSSVKAGRRRKGKASRDSSKGSQTSRISRDSPGVTIV